MLNGQDIKLKLKLSNKDRTCKTMSIRVNAQAMRYNGKLAQNIQSTVQEKILLPGQGLQLFLNTFFHHQTKKKNCLYQSLTLCESNSSYLEVF